MNLPFCRLVPLDRYNWEQVLEVKITPEQERFTPSILYSLAQARFENLQAFGVEYADQIVGMVMYGEFSGLCWISRVFIDHEFQRKGIGSKAVKLLVEQLQGSIRCKEIRSSYDPLNLAAAGLYKSLGFQEMENGLEDEVVVKYVKSFV
ncbi:MAG: GNAT family N-acetyltransferase [Bacteroidota bacterium]